jgi:hypothetical protein
LRLAEARERVLSGSEVPGVRAPVRASWARAGNSGVDPDRGLPPVPLCESEVLGLREQHPLAAVWPLLAESLRDAITEPGHGVFLADERGHLLWVDGDRATLCRGSRRGSRWTSGKASPCCPAARR